MVHEATCKQTRTWHQHAQDPVLDCDNRLCTDWEQVVIVGSMAMYCSKVMMSAALELKVSLRPEPTSELFVGLQEVSGDGGDGVPTMVRLRAGVSFPRSSCADIWTCNHKQVLQVQARS